MTMDSGVDPHLIEDVRAGLRARPRRLSSKYFYDERGSEIFRQIMRMPTYYLTDCEFEIFETHRVALHEAVTAPGSDFRLIEFGVGDGSKTKVLLEHFLSQGTGFTFTPIDISGDALRQLAQTLADRFPDLAVEAVEDDYFR
ncbi:MAG: L-histidine N(alpha)-methyltransferase, partial [Bacteroidetes bacterium]